MMADWDNNAPMNWNNTPAGGDMGGPVGPVVDEPQEIREKKINKKRLAELIDDENKKTLEIWIRNPMSRVNKKYCTVYLEPTAICCDEVYKARSTAEKNGDRLKIYYLPLTEGEDLDAYRYVLRWVGRCGREKAVAEISDVSDIFNEAKGWQHLLDIFSAAQKLGVPTASFSRQIARVAKKVAKNILPDLDFVGNVYDPLHGDADLAAMAAATIFHFWYNWTLDAEEYDTYMARLQEMRAGMPDLDRDIQAALEDKDEFIKRKRDEKRKEREAADVSAQGNSFDDGDGGNANTEVVNGDWAQGSSGTDGVAEQQPQSWAQGYASASNVSSWENDNNGAAAGGVNWADDANDANANFNPVPAITSW